MAYCPKCGNEISDNAVICVNCGQSQTKNKSVGKDNEHGFWLFLLSLFIPLIGFIVGIVMYNEGKKKSAKKCFWGAAIGTIIATLFSLLLALMPFIIMFFESRVYEIL